MDTTKGAYLVILRLTSGLTLPSFPGGAVNMPAGRYLYAGSAWGGGGIRARLARHFREEKKLHWHIDRLSLAAATLTGLAVPGGRECDLVESLLKSGRFRIAVPGFGSSDCRRCESHLLRFDGRT